MYDKILSTIRIGSYGDFSNTRGPLKIEAICVSKMSVTQPTSTRSYNMNTRTTFIVDRALLNLYIVHSPTNTLFIKLGKV